MSKTVFYSWQSDLPNNVNRGFIENALKQALKELSADTEVEECPRLDKDTQDVPGTPPVVDTIFKKIDQCGVIVPDLTFIGTTTEPRKDTGKPRLIPNPNVLIEYGYAAKSLGYERIIPVMNEAYGEANDQNLPFDIKHLRRPVTYSLQNNHTPKEKAEVKAALVVSLKAKIKAAYDSGFFVEEQNNESHDQFYRSLNEQLINIIIFADEFESRNVKPWLDQLLGEFQRDSHNLRKFATADVAVNDGIENELYELAEILEQVVNHVPTFSTESNSTHAGYIKDAGSKAREIKNKYSAKTSLPKELTDRLWVQMSQYARQLEDFASRADSMINTGAFDDMRSEVSRIGYYIMRYYLFQESKLDQEIYEIARQLFAIETKRRPRDGGQSDQRIISMLSELSGRLSALILKKKAA